MAYEIPGFVYNAPNDGAIIQFRAVTLGPDGLVAPGVLAAHRIDGVAQMSAAATQVEAIRVMKKGITFARAGAAIAAGAQVEADAVGDFVTLAMGQVAGRALTGAGGAGVYIALLLY